MSDVTLLGVLRMPVSPNSDYMALAQLINRAREAADRIEALEAENERLRGHARYQRTALEGLQMVLRRGALVSRDIATLDHDLVPLFKAALAEGGDNGSGEVGNVRPEAR